MRLADGCRTGKTAALFLLTIACVGIAKQAAGAEAEVLPAAGALTIGGQPVGGQAAGAQTAGGEVVHYAKLVQSRVMKAMELVDGLIGTKFHIVIDIRLNPTGGVVEANVREGTGDGDLDNQIQQAIVMMPAIPEAPPPNMPLKMLVRLRSKD